MSDEEYAVKFVRACSDKIGTLVQFHDSPMPYFLFYMVRQRTSNCPRSLRSVPAGLLSGSDWSDFGLTRCRRPPPRPSER